MCVQVQIIPAHNRPSAEPSFTSCTNMNLKLLVVNITLLYCATMLQARPETFKLRVINDGRVFDEDVTIDVAKQTATFHVPSHEGMAEADVIHDFRKKLTMISLPEKQVCYISRLNDNLPRPENIINSYKKAATVSNDSNFQRVKSAMVTKELIEDRSSLSYAMRNMCQNFPIYRIEPLDDSISITRDKTRARLRRGTCSSTVCYTTEECYYTCPSQSCRECKEKIICHVIDC